VQIAKAFLFKASQYVEWLVEGTFIRSIGSATKRAGLEKLYPKARFSVGQPFTLSAQIDADRKEWGFSANSRHDYSLLRKRSFRHHFAFSALTREIVVA
jgi:hypothetical protein